MSTTNNLIDVLKEHNVFYTPLTESYYIALETIHITLDSNSNTIYQQACTLLLVEPLVQDNKNNLPDFYIPPHLVRQAQQCASIITLLKNNDDDIWQPSDVDKLIISQITDRDMLYILLAYFCVNEFYLNSTSHVRTYLRMRILTPNWS